MQCLFRDRSGRAKDSSSMTHWTGKMTLQPHTRKINGKHKSREQYSLPAERVAENAKKKRVCTVDACLRWQRKRGKQTERWRRACEHRKSGKRPGPHFPISHAP